MADVTARGRGGWIVAGVILAFAGLVALAIVRSRGSRGGVEPIAWDREVCAQCHMHIGDPRFAAQLQTINGQVLDFDDPGCLFVYATQRRPAIGEAYFHLMRTDQWLPRGEVAFVPGQTTPMGYGFGAVAPGEPGALPFDEVQGRIAAAQDAGG